MTVTNKKSGKMPLVEAFTHDQSEGLDCYQFDLLIEENCVYFDGHFDGQPILPGVVQIHWVMNLLDIYVDGFDAKSKSKIFSGLPQVKFTQPIYPNERLILSVRINHGKQNLNFEFYNPTHSFSVGKISYI